jgi:hypothetical protein
VNNSSPISFGYSGTTLIAENNTDSSAFVGTFGLTGAASGVSVAATQVGTSVPVAFTVAAGQPLAFGAAPARRVGIGIPNWASSSGDGFSALMWRGYDLFDSALRWVRQQVYTPNKSAVCVFGYLPWVYPSEIHMRARLHNLGFSTFVSTSSSTTASLNFNPNSFDLVLSPKSQSTSRAHPSLYSTTTPTIFQEDNAQQLAFYATINETNPQQPNTAWHALGDTVNINQNAPTMLKAGLTGTVSFYHETDQIQFAPRVGSVSNLPNTATIVAGYSTNLERPAVYVFDTGHILANGTAAPGRRAFFGVYYDTYRKITPNGLSLFDALVAWMTR